MIAATTNEAVPETPAESAPDFRNNFFAALNLINPAFPPHTRG